MLKLLEFLVGIDPDCTGYSSALVRTIDGKTGLSKEEIHQMTVDAEDHGLVESIKLSLSGADGLLAVRLTPKGRKRLKALKSVFYANSKKTTY